ncbi:glutamate receptor [Nasonia vitripennis]|uniref:Uncharacterized protein n=1 Tax=Nasonia vitripennis TaxID=7425 RepID=A0A7M7QHZ2_NASVI|nr:glutamate receptor [Nasonia vitripennis]
MASLPLTLMCFMMAFSQPTEPQLVMEAHLYMKIMESVHTIFNNTCVIIMYTIEDPMQALDPYDAAQLMSILQYSSRLHVRTFAYAIKTFKEMIGDEYFNLKRPLFILINDSEDMRTQFSTVIAPWISMAYINWVVFFREDTSVDDFFSEMYVPLDCIFLIVKKSKDNSTYTLTEVYHIAKGRELISDVYGSWSEARGLSITKWTLYQRRSDLRGQLIRVTTVEDPPISMIQRDESGLMTGIKGFFGTIVQILQENLNCTMVYSETDSWGARLANGSWTGAVGQLVRNESDLAATELLMTADRLQAIEFTTPVFSTRCRTFIKRPYYTAVKWTAYSDPFYVGIWLALLGVMLIASAFTIICFRVSPSQKLASNADEEDASFSEIFFHVFGALCAQGHESVVLDSIRVINLVVHITGVIILAAYSAALISFLAVKVFVMPFTSMEGLLEDGSYKLGVIRDSSDYNIFQNSSDRILQRMFEEIMDEVENLPRNYLEGLNFVCSKDKYAFMTTDNMFSILEHQVPCILEPLDVIMQTTMGMAVPSRSPFRGIINSNILLMRDSGVLQRVIATELVIQHAKQTQGWSSVEIVDVLPLLLLILAGYFCGLVLLSLEKLQYSKLRKVKFSFARKLQRLSQPTDK